MTSQNLSRSVVQKSATMLFLTQIAWKILCVVHMKENAEVDNETVTSSLHIWPSPISTLPPSWFVNKYVKRRNPYVVLALWLQYFLHCWNNIARSRTFKLLRRLGIDLRNGFRQPMYSLACRYDNPIPTRFLAPLDCSKIPAQFRKSWCRGDSYNQGST